MPFSISSFFLLFFPSGEGHVWLLPWGGAKISPTHPDGCYGLDGLRTAHGSNGPQVLKGSRAEPQWPTGDETRGVGDVCIESMKNRELMASKTPWGSQQCQDIEQGDQVDKCLSEGERVCVFRCLKRLFVTMHLTDSHARLGVM